MARGGCPQSGLQNLWPTERKHLEIPGFAPQTPP